MGRNSKGRTTIFFGGGPGGRPLKKLFLHSLFLNTKLREYMKRCKPRNSNTQGESVQGETLQGESVIGEM